MSAFRFTVRGETAETWHECLTGSVTLCGLTIAGRLRHSRGEVGCERCKAKRVELDRALIREANERRATETATPGLAKVIDLAEERRRRSKGAA